MGTLGNGYVYTNAEAQKSLELDCSYQYTHYIKIFYTEYYNINNNTSCLTIDKLQYKGTAATLLAFQNVNGGASSTQISSEHFGFRFDGGQMLDSSGSPIIFNMYSPATHYINVPSASSYKDFLVQREGTPAFPYYSPVISHNNDGSRSITIGINLYLYFMSGSSTFTSEARASTTIQLKTIPRASSFTVGNATVGGSSTITITKQISTATHTVKATYSDGYQQTIATSSAATSLTFTPNAAHAYASMGSTGTSTTITFTCSTINSGSTIGTATTTATVYANESDCKPVVSVSCEVLNDKPTLTGTTNKIILNYSNVKSTLTITYKNGATASSAYIQNGTTKIDGTQATFNKVVSNQFQVYVKDSRGYITQLTFAPSCVNYFVPSYTVQASAPSTSTGLATCSVSGNFFNDTFGARQNGVAMSIYFYDETTQTSESEFVMPTTSGNTFQGSASFSGDYTHSYYFKVSIADQLSTILSQEYHVRTLPVFDWDKDDFNVNVNSNINGSLNVNGQITVNSQSLADTIKAQIMNSVYPVGAIYISTSSANPATLFGVGTWQRIEGKFLLAASSPMGYPAGQTGGEATHTLTTNEIPAHTHKTTYELGFNGLILKWDNQAEGGRYYGAQAQSGSYQSSSAVALNQLTTGGAGGGAAHNNMPPYLAVYMWKRTA